MKLLKPLLIIIVIISNGSLEAQVTNWIKKQTKYITNTDTYKKVEKSVSSMDPQQYFIEKINENFDIDSYINDINNSFNQTNIAIHNNLNFYKDSVEDFKNSFVNATTYLNKLASLQLEGTFKQFGTTITINDNHYILFNNGNAYYAVSEDNMPIDNNLLYAIKTAYWKDRSSYINQEYIENIEVIASTLEAMNRYLIEFLEFSSTSFNKIMHFKYGKFSTELLLNEKISSLGIDMNIDDIELNLNQITDSLKIMQNAVLEIKNNCGKIITHIDQLNNASSVNYSQLDNDINNLSQMADMFTTIARLSQNYADISKEYKDDFSHFVDFYGISFIEGFASFYDMAINQYLAIAKESEKRAFTIRKFIEDINKKSSEFYKESSKSYEKITKKIIKNDIEQINAFVGLYKQISKDKRLNQKNDPFLRYLKKINKQLHTMNKSSKKDFFKFLTVEKKLKNSYDGFPSKKAENYYKNILSSVDSKQIIGGSFTENYFDDYKRIISKIKHNKRAVNQLKIKTRELNKYYDQASSSNSTFYIVLSLLLMGAIGGAYFKIFR